jgi:uncharacterized membrane protein YjgN (DUF898 family)
MARTRWRGIRFGMDGGAGGYTLRALCYSFLSLITGGLLYPYQQFKLAKYMTDRTYFGDLKFHQNGSWAGLFAYWVWLYIVLGLIALTLWGLAADYNNLATRVIGFVIIFMGYITVFVLFMRYEVIVFRYLWSNRVLGEASFQNDIAPGRIISVYVVGTFLVGLCTILVGVAVLGAILGIGYYFQDVPLMTQLEQLQTMNEGIAITPDSAQGFAGLALTAVFIYLMFFAVPFAYAQIFITRPILQRKTEAMVIHNFDVLSRSRQRAHDHAAEAGGFADALGVDVGAGI